MEDDLHTLKEQMVQQSLLIEQLSQNLKRKDDQVHLLQKQNEKIEKEQQQMLKQLDIFDELTTDRNGKRIQYSVKANLKSEIMQSIVEELSFQQSLTKIDQKIQDMNFNQNQKISQMQKDLVNVETYCNSHLGKFKESIEFIQELEKNKNVQKNFLQKYDVLMEKLQKQDLQLCEVVNKYELVESELNRKIDINDLNRISDLVKDEFISKQYFALQLDNTQSKLYNEIKSKAAHTDQLANSIHLIQSRIDELNTSLLQYKNYNIIKTISNNNNNNNYKVIKEFHNNTHKQQDDEQQEMNKQLLKNAKEDTKGELKEINNQLKEEFDKKLEDIREILKSQIIKQSEEFNTQITDYQGQIMILKTNIDSKLKNQQNIVSSIQSSAQEASKKSKEVELFVLDNMLTKDFVRDFQKKVNQKIDNFDKGYTETIEKLTQISNRANDSLGDLAIRLQLIPTREELIQRLEFVQAVSTDNQAIKSDISTIMELIKNHDEFFLLKASKIDLQQIQEQLDVIKMKQPDYIVMQCEKNVNLIQDEVKECQKEMIDFRKEIIKMLNFSIFDEGELESYQQNNHQKVMSDNNQKGNLVQHLKQSNNQIPQASPSKPNRAHSKSIQKHMNQEQRGKNIEKDEWIQVEEDETGRKIFAWVEQIRKGIFDTYKVYDVLYTKANHSQVQELFDKKANKMIVAKLMDMLNNMKKQLVYLVVSQNQLIRAIRNSSESGSQTHNQKEENRHKKEIELQSLLRQNTKLLVWISSQDLEQDQSFVKKLKEKNGVTIDFNMMDQMVDEVFQRYQQLNKLYLKQPNVKYTQEEIKLLDNFVRDIIPNRQLSLHEIHPLRTDQNDHLIHETEPSSQHINSSKIIVARSQTNYESQISIKQEGDIEEGETEATGQQKKKKLKQVILNDSSMMEVDNTSSMIKIHLNQEATIKNGKSKARINLSDKKDKLSRSQYNTHQSTQQNAGQDEEEEDERVGGGGNLFLKQIQKDTQLLKDSLNTLITKDGYTKIYITPEETEQIKKEQNYLKSSSTFISKKASTVSATRNWKRMQLSNQFKTTNSEESLQYFDLLSNINNKSFEQKLINSNIVVQTHTKKDQYKKAKPTHKNYGVKLNLSTHLQRSQVFDEFTSTDQNINEQIYSDSLTQQSVDLSTQYSRKNRNQTSFSLSNKKQKYSNSEHNTPRDTLFINKSPRKQSNIKNQNQTSSYDITDY